MKCRSEWHSPATAVRIKTSRGPGLGRLTSSITSGLLTSYKTAAFIGVSSFCLCTRFETRKMRSLSPCGRGKITLLTLRQLQQFANLVDADGALAEQMAGDRALQRIFREPERIAGRHPVID